MYRFAFTRHSALDAESRSIQQILGKPSEQVRVAGLLNLIQYRNDG